MPFATPTWDKDLACVVINLSSKVVATTRTQFPGDEDYYLAIPTLTKIFIRSFHQEFPALSQKFIVPRHRPKRTIRRDALVIELL